MQSLEGSSDFVIISAGFSEVSMYAVGLCPRFIDSGA